jgi:hypothetical protein
MALTSQLDGVNEVLAGIGESPVNGLSSGFVTASMANTRLESVSREVQETGWYFNTETKRKLAVDSEGFIPVPFNTLRVDGSAVRGGHLVQRGSRLYNLENHSFTFTQSAEVDIVLELAFEELPEAAKRYIILRSKRKFQDDILGDTFQHQMQAPDELEALQKLKQMDSETGDYNIFDNYDLADWIRRDI